MRRTDTSKRPGSNQTAERVRGVAAAPALPPALIPAIQRQGGPSRIAACKRLGRSDDGRGELTRQDESPDNPRRVVAFRQRPSRHGVVRRLAPAGASDRAKGQDRSSLFKLSAPEASEHAIGMLQ